MPFAFRLIICAIGAFLFVLSLWTAKANARAQTWPSTPGRIQRSELETDDDGDSFVRVRYGYKVGAKSYLSTRIAYAAFRADRPAQLRLVAQFHEGKRVDVFYDPRNPGNSVLLRDPSSLWLVATAIGLIFFAVGVFAP